MSQLAGLNSLTGVNAPEPDFEMSAEAREMLAWQTQLAHEHQTAVGEEIYDEDIAIMRSEL